MNLFIFVIIHSLFIIYIASSHFLTTISDKRESLALIERSSNRALLDANIVSEMATRRGYPLQKSFQKEAILPQRYDSAFLSRGKCNLYPLKKDRTLIPLYAKLFETLYAPSLKQHSFEWHNFTQALQRALNNKADQCNYLLNPKYLVLHHHQNLFNALHSGIYLSPNGNFISLLPLETYFCYSESHSKIFSIKYTLPDLILAMLGNEIGTQFLDYEKKITLERGSQITAKEVQEYIFSCNPDIKPSTFLSICSFKSFRSIERISLHEKEVKYIDSRNERTIL